MKNSLLSLFLATGYLLAGQVSNGQDLSRIVITIHLKNSTLKKAFHEMEALSHVSFTYKTDDISGYKNINLYEVQIPLSALLEELLGGTDLGYEQVNTTIIIKKKKKISGNAPTFQALSVDTIRGKVIDEKGDVLAGVTVRIKDQTKASLTDIFGNFLVVVPDKRIALVFSYVGHTGRVIDLKKEDPTLVVLNTMPFNMSEVVVTALGISKESNKLGYAVTTIGGDQLTKARETNVALSLEGQVAGLNVHGTSGGAGSTARIVLRGMPSMNSGGSPLFVINGVPIDNSQRGAAGEWGGSDNGDGIGNINPDDIESMTVLKGQSASALYGSRASNGVILITTKTGKKGDFSIDYNTNYMVDKAIDNTDYQYVYGQGQNGNKPANIAEAQNTARLSWGAKLDGTPAIQFDGKQYAYSPYKNNIAHFYRTAPSFTNTLAVTSGTDKTSFRLSVSNLNAQSILRNSGLTRKTINLTLEQKMTERLKANVMINYIDEQSKNRPQLSDGPMNANNGLFLANNIDEAILAPGYNPVNGYEIQFSDDNFVTNPWFVVNQYINNLSRQRIISAVSVRYNFTDRLYAQGRIGYDLENDGVFHVTPWGTGYPTRNETFKGQLDELSRAESYELNTDGLIGFSKHLIGDLNLDLAVGANLRTNGHEKTGINGGAFVLPYLYVFNNVVNFGRTYEYWASEVQSAYYTADLAYKNFLSLNTTGRYDVYSTLPANNRSLFTPSLSGSFIFSELVRIPHLSYGKLRASYAQTSGEPPLPYNTSVYYGIGNSLNGTPTGYFNNSLPNGQLKPFTLTETELGAELKFFHDRLAFDIAFFSRQTHNEIMGASFSAASGYTTGFTGTGSTQNKGVEWQVTGIPVQTKDLNWTISLNFTDLQNKILQTYAYGNTQILGTDRPSHGKAVTAYVKGLSGPQILVHDYKYDTKGNMVVDASGLPVMGNLVPMGGVLPTLYGGLNNEVNYKSFGLSFLLEYNYGNGILSASKYYAVYRGLDKMTLAGRENGITAGVQEDGTPNTATASAQNYYQALANNVQKISVLKGDYIKLRQITLSYNIVSGKLLDKMPVFKSIQISLVARNLLTLLKYSGNIDPEATFGSNVQYAGIEGTSLPSTRSLGINASFGFK